MNRIKRIFNKIRPRKSHLIISIFVTLNILFLFLIAGFFIPKTNIHAQAACKLQNPGYFATVKVIVKTTNNAPLPNDLGLHTWTSTCYNGWDNGIPMNSSYNPNLQNWFEASGPIQGPVLFNPSTPGTVSSAQIVNYYNTHNNTAPSTFQDFGTFNVGNNAVGYDHPNLSNGVIASCPSNTGCSHMGGNISLGVVSGSLNNASAVALEYYQVIDCAFSPVNYQLSGLPSGWTSSGNSNTVNVTNSPAVPTYTITVTPPTPAPAPIWACNLTLTANPTSNLSPLGGSTTLSGVLTVTENGTKVLASAANQKVQISVSPSNINSALSVTPNPVNTGSTGAYSAQVTIVIPPFSGPATFSAKYTSPISGITCSSSPVTVTWSTSTSTPIWACSLTLTANPSKIAGNGSSTLSGILTVTKNGTTVVASAANQPIQIVVPANEGFVTNPSNVVTGASGAYSAQVFNGVPPFPGTFQFSAKYTSPISGITCSASPVTVTWSTSTSTITATLSCSGINYSTTNFVSGDYVSGVINGYSSMQLSKNTNSSGIFNGNIFKSAENINQPVTATIYIYNASGSSLASVTTNSENLYNCVSHPAQVSITATLTCSGVAWNAVNIQSGDVISGTVYNTTNNQSVATIPQSTQSTGSYNGFVQSLENSNVTYNAIMVVSNSSGTKITSSPATNSFNFTTCVSPVVTPVLSTVTLACEQGSSNMVINWTDQTNTINSSDQFYGVINDVTSNKNNVFSFNSLATANNYVWNGANSTDSYTVVGYIKGSNGTSNSITSSSANIISCQKPVSPVLSSISLACLNNTTNNLAIKWTGTNVSSNDQFTGFVTDTTTKSQVANIPQIQASLGEYIWQGANGKDSYTVTGWIVGPNGTKYNVTTTSVVASTCIPTTVTTQAPIVQAPIQQLPQTSGSSPIDVLAAMGSVIVLIGVGLLML